MDLFPLNKQNRLVRYRETVGAETGLDNNQPTTASHLLEPRLNRR